MSKKEIECIDCGPGVISESLSDRLVIKDKIAIIPGLEGMFDEAIKLRLTSRVKVSDELLKMLKKMYKVPEGEEKDYRDALMDEYDRRTTEFL